ncbi:hypothetical protein ONK27_26150, partial [Salmonella enterica subsp. enterica serovar Virginia]|nr:hypothetical protein [Salmonella enterica subsp. enterica serovar Virginia]
PQIYQLPTVATWRSSYTTAMMILTPLIGGGALAALFGVRRLGDHHRNQNRSGTGVREDARHQTHHHHNGEDQLFFCFREARDDA